MSSRNNNDEEDATFPWAWWKAFQAIVKEDPPENIPDPPVAVLPWLYLAPFHCVTGEKGSKIQETFGITHVLSTNRMPPHVLETLYWELRSIDVNHNYVAALDQLSYDMMAEHWEECRNFIQEARSCTPNAKILVHCAAGMNRSGTIVAAAMMDFANMDLLDVARELKLKRGYVLSNESFQKQLVRFAALKGRLGEKPEGYNDDPVQSSDD